ncbi:MAG: carboxypeptidase regulatory-like domain-containing protein [Verrucomicrobia bacterium]|nr:carboxypeptidase regulatory-like domain-containing protein [Verrucomicrobiota bacterium]
MKTRIGSGWASFVAMVMAFSAAAQVTPEDGDWSAQTVSILNTPQAQLMVRVGDIDNLGFGWPEGFDPFSGETTPAHTYPWEVDPLETAGTDRIMVVTSYEGNPPAGQDGYTSFTQRPDNAVRPIVLTYTLGGVSLQNAALQIFLDDFQAPVWQANYQVTVNGQRVAGLEALINQLSQTGPVGRLVTFELPSQFYAAVASGRLEFEFDDRTTGAGDGYAIDFIKLLVNRTGALSTGTITGVVTAAGTGQPIANAVVTSFDRQATTDAAGNYTLTNVPAGLAYVTASAAGYESASRFAEIIVGQTTPDVDFVLAVDTTFRLNIYVAVELEFFARQGENYVLQYSADLTTWHNDEQITGSNQWVSRLRSTRPATQRYWRAERL